MWSYVMLINGRATNKVRGSSPAWGPRASHRVDSGAMLQAHQLPPRQDASVLVRVSTVAGATRSQPLAP